MSTRYIRQTALPELGSAGQERIQKAKVLVVGAGGLGSPVLFYLAAAGVGKIAIIDHDTIELSNLQRQILFKENDIGQFKAISAANHLKSFNSECEIVAHNEKLTAENISQFITNYDLIFDCTDDLYTKYVMNDQCFIQDKPYISASLLKFNAQVVLYRGKTGPCMRCLFPATSYVSLQNCQSAGILGAVAGMIGSLQALEGLKWLSGISVNASPELFILDTIQYSWQRYTIPKDPDCALCGMESASSLIYPQVNHFCHNEEISAEELKICLQQKSALLIDVRSPEEHQARNIGGINIPLQELKSRSIHLSKTNYYVLYCQAGLRSQQAVHMLREHGFLQIKSLRGGLNEWDIPNAV